MIFCEYKLCIYNKKNKCVLENVSIDSLGLCNGCEIPILPEVIVETFKEEMLKNRYFELEIDSSEETL